MKAAFQIEAKSLTHADGDRLRGPQPFYTIPELSARWRCSRATVYNILRGEKVLDFAALGRKGKKLVPADVVCAIEERKMRVWR